MDILNSQLGSEEKNNSNSGKELITREPIEGSPFTLVKLDTGAITKYFITMGMYKISDDYTSEVEALTNLEANRWNIITMTAGIIAEQVYKNNKNDEIEKYKTQQTGL